MAASGDMANAATVVRTGVGEVRPLERADVPQAAAIFGRAFAPDSTAAGLERLLASVALEDPWTDPELPSLVLNGDEGDVVGLLLTCPRRLVFDGQPLRALCGSNVVVDPAVQGKAQGMALIERSKAFPKDFAYTDGATDRARGMLERAGYTLLTLESLEWTSVLRPTAYWQGRLFTGSRTRRIGAIGRILVRPLDRLLGRTPFAPAVRTPGLTHEPLTPALMMEHLEQFTSWARLRVDYDMPFLTWLFAQLADDHPQGSLAARLVRRDGEAIGWHISLVPRGGIAQVMQIVAAPGDAPAVLSSMLVHARELGAVAARGRLEAPLLEAVTARRTVLRGAGFVYVRAPNDPAIVSAIQSGHALITRLDADWWIDPAGR